MGSVNPTRIEEKVMALSKRTQLHCVHKLRVVDGALGIYRAGF